MLPNRYFQTLLEILDADIYSNPTHISSLIITARLHLSRVRSNPCPEPDPASPAYLAIDPYIARTLISFIPLRKLDLPSSPYVWDTLQSLLDAWDELLALSRTHNLATWEVSGRSAIVLHVSKVFDRSCAISVLGLHI